MTDYLDHNRFESLKINIGTVMIYPKMLKFVADLLKTKKVCKHAVKTLPFVIRYVADRYKTQQMCDKSIPVNSRTYS